MKRRFDCAGGHAEEMQHSARRKRKTLHVAKRGSGQRSNERSRPVNSHDHGDWNNRDRYATGLPESPWDPRLHHPWVAAYRRIHSNSKPGRNG